MSQAARKTSNFIRQVGRDDALSSLHEIPDSADLPDFTLSRLRERTCSSCLVIPVWNEGERIRRQLARLQPYLSDVNIIIVDGGSSDGETAPDALNRAGVHALLVTQARGLGTALRIGIAFALAEGYEQILTMDGNDKDEVGKVREVIARLRGGYDFVQASRFLPGATHKHSPLLRVMGIRLVIVPVLRWTARFAFTDPTNGFKGMSRDFLLHPGLRPFRAVFEQFNFQFYLNPGCPFGIQSV